ncbi:hypothetical protein RSAG8_04400, partial [Rhizoctonia solani AG-8 WAC10335]
MQTPSVESRFYQRLKFRPSLRASLSTLPLPSCPTVALCTASDTLVSFVDENYNAAA